MQGLLDSLPAMGQTTWILLGLGLLVAIILVQTILLSRRSKRGKLPESNGSIPVMVNSADVPSLLTEPELACFNKLYEVAGKEFHVMAKVALSDLAIVKRGVDRALLEKVSRNHHHIDFVLCTRESMSVSCAIELQDLGRKDVGPSELLMQVGIPVFKLPRKTSYSLPEIRKILEPFLKEAPPSPDQMVATISMEAFRSCKKCQTRMVLKRAKSGKYKGTLFWVCGKYPECRTMELFTR
ncbi:MAG TPA: DUF2726 domain-containing protein [Mariprofundaceae bacterium]|nr:DUF2726 domain-containing protein [Mariprofundaceae bacterium]